MSDGCCSTALYARVSFTSIDDLEYGPLVIYFNRKNSFNTDLLSF